MNNKLIYLASPYTHPEPAMREHRFREICRISAHLLSQGIHVYSPIVHTHPIAEHGNLDGTWDFWEPYDRRMIAACDEVWFVMMPGWCESRGMDAELQIAKELGKVFNFYKPEYLMEMKGE